MMELSSTVPMRYRGVWRRKLLIAPGVIDTDSTVLWLQASRWHADIRIPARRPSFAGVAALSDCNDEQLRLLARRQGFAGITEVDLEPMPEICRWRRRWDVQPPAATPDAGRMVFRDARLTESGLHGDYIEEWERLPDSQGDTLELVDEAGCLLIAGKHVMRVAPRRVDWPSGVTPGTSLEQMVEAALPADRARVIGWLDFEISYGRLEYDAWTVQHSTLPWLEGRRLPLPAGMDVNTWDAL
jgi:hypothetical protein